MIELNVHMQEGDLKQSLTLLNSIKEKAVKKAFVRATRKMSRWMTTHVSRDIAQQYGISPRKFKDLRIRLTSGDFGAHTKPAMVWIGIAPMGAHLFGQPKADDSIGGGVWVRDYFFKGAFIMADQNDEEQVWARRSRKRLPLDLQKIDIRQGAVLAVRRLVARGEQRFKTILTQEVQFELSKLQ